MATNLHLSIDLEQELDRLYRLPAREFVARRNDLAKRLNKTGDRDAAGRVKKLPRPSLTAWAVNQLAFRAGAELEGLRAAGERVRAAHLAGPKEQQAAARARREAISTLCLIAEVALQEAGASPTRSHRQRISQTLEVLSSQGSGADQPRAGRLSVDLEPAGFDALADLAAALVAAQMARPRAVEEAEGAAGAPAAEKPAETRIRPRAAAAGAGAKVVEHPAAKRKADLEERRAAERRQLDRRRAAERRQLDRRREQARTRLEELEEKISGLGSRADTAAGELDAAKEAESALVQAADEAERVAREARARADAAAALTARARREAEVTSATQRLVAGEIEQVRQELQGLEAALGALLK